MAQVNPASEGTIAATAPAKSVRANLLAQVTCPHCWHRFRLHEVVWIARHEDLRGDPVLGPDEMIRFRPSRFTVAGEAIDARGNPCQWLACPNCHLSLPRVFLENEALIVSLFGVPFSGKSYFLASMTWSLRQTLAARFNLAFTDADPAANQTLRDYEDTLFIGANRDQLAGLSKTQMESDVTYTEVQLAGQPVRLPRPFLFNLRPTAGHPHAHDDRFSRVMCLYDNAGEHFLPGADTALAPGTQHLARAHVLMFLFDPTQDPRFRQRCQAISNDPQLRKQARTQLQSTVLTEAAVRVRQYGSVPPNQKVARPLLVLVSKADIWSSLIGEDLSVEPFLAPSVPGGPAVVDVRRVAVVSARLRKLLMEVSPDLVVAAEEFCHRVVYVPVSSLGGSPVTAPGSSMLVVKPRELRPQWVTVPLASAFALWSSGLTFGNQDGSSGGGGGSIAPLPDPLAAKPQRDPPIHDLPPI